MVKPLQTVKIFMSDETRKTVPELEADDVSGGSSPLRSRTGSREVGVFGAVDDEPDVPETESTVVKMLPELPEVLEEDPGRGMTGGPTRLSRIFEATLFVVGSASTIAPQRSIRRMRDFIEVGRVD